MVLFFNRLKSNRINFEFDVYADLSLYESVEYIIRSFDLNTASDAYLQFFLDEVLRFSQKKTTETAAFLEFWKEKKDSLSIFVPEGKNAVRIMTIHKSKGLEFPIVIYPYELDIYKELNSKVWYEIPNSEELNDFDSLLINYNKSLEFTGVIGEELYQTHRNELELDSFNLLYVALTRAVEQLYVILETKKSNENLKTSSQFFMHYLQSNDNWNENQADYCLGDSKRISDKPISSKSNIELDELISTSWHTHNITIVANSSLLWDDEIQDSITYGNLIHELLANIKIRDDIDGTIETYIIRGIIANTQAQNIKKMLIKVIEHPELENYYQQNITVYNEREILSATGEIIIPDRMIINDNNEAIIIDYKTGKPDKKYHDQLNTYGSIIEQLGYKVIKKLLVYIGENIVIDKVTD